MIDFATIRLRAEQGLDASDQETLALLDRIAELTDVLIGAALVIRMLAPTGQETTLSTISERIERLPAHRAALPADFPRAPARRADRARSIKLRALDLFQHPADQRHPLPFRNAFGTTCRV